MPEIAPLDTALFRQVARTNPQALLAMAVSLGQVRDARSLQEMLPAFAKELRDTSYYKDCDGATIHHEKDQSNEVGRKWTFNQAFLQALAPILNANGEPQAQWSRAQAEFFDHLQWPVAQRTSQSVEEFLCEAAEVVADPRVLQILNRCDTELTRKMMSRAVLGGKLDVLLDLAQNLARHEPLSVWVREFLPNHEFRFGYAGGCNALRKAFNESPEKRAKVLEFVALLDPAEAGIFRLEFLSQELHSAWSDDKPFSTGRMVQIMDAQSPEEALKEVARLASTFDFSKELALKATLFDDNPAFSKPLVGLMQNALQAHCAPVLQAIKRTFGRVAKDIDAFRLVTTSPLKNVDAFKATVAFVHEYGHPLHANEKDEEASRLKGQAPLVPALVALARPEWMEDRGPKLAALLELGADPAAKTAKFKVPHMMLPAGEERDTWKHLILTHKARKVAFDSIHEMMTEKPTAPTP